MMREKFQLHQNNNANGRYNCSIVKTVLSLLIELKIKYINAEGKYRIASCKIMRGIIQVGPSCD